MTATIKEVAAQAGVSVGTVSNVLNNRPVKADNRLRVLRAMKELDYTPNSIARMLKTRISKTIGLLVPDINNPFYSELARGAEDQSRRYGNTLFLCNTDRNTKKENAYLDALIDKGADGIIIVKPSITPMRLADLSRKCPMVLIDATYEKGDRHNILNVDDEGGARLVMEFLYKLGHRNIYYFMGSTEARSDLERYSGYRSFMENHGLYREDFVVRCGEYSIDAGCFHAAQLFGNSSFPHAIFAANDLLALGATQAAFNHGLSVPEDLSIAGCDDIVFSRYTRPTLTTLNRPKYQLGTEGVKLLIDGFADTDRPSRTLPSELVVRNSCIRRG